VVFSATIDSPESDMKNFLILGLLAMFLFSVSAALSLWLQQAKQQQHDAAEKEKDKEKTPSPDKDKSAIDKSGQPKETIEPKPRPASKDTPASPLSEADLKRLRDTEAKLERRAAQIELVIRDIQTQRQRNEFLLQQVMAELKNLPAETSKLDAMLKDLNNRTVEYNALEDANITKLATMYEAMAPEAAAPILKEMSEKGRMDTAAKILVKMKERNSARILEALEPSLSSQLIERMLRIRSASTTPGPGKSP
jgi:flagellar motility protein MotE (MotC chaperone)